MTDTINSPIVVPSTYIEVLYSTGKESVNISKYIESLTYKDFEKDQSDELELRIIDKDGSFLNDAEKYPQKGTKISAKIGYSGEKSLNCGTFTVDEIGLDSTDNGDILVIRALAASINAPLRQKNTRYFIGKTLVQIAKWIGSLHGYTVGGSEGFIELPRVDQYKESDLEFLRRIAAEHGYIFKLTDMLITFTKAENLETSKPLSVIQKADISSLSLTDTTAKTYNACSVKYYNPKTGKYTGVTVKGSKKDVKTETLKLDVKCQTKEQAIARANAALKTGQSTVEGSIALKRGNRYCIAGANFTLKEYGVLSGKYHVKTSTHTVSRENYETSMEVKKIA